MQLTVKPVFVVGQAWPVLPQPDGVLRVVIDKESADSTIEGIKEVTGPASTYS